MIEKFVNLVKDFKLKDSLLMWNLSNENLTRLEGNFSGGALTTQVAGYLNLIKDMAEAARQEDPDHPIVFVDNQSFY